MRSRLIPLKTKVGSRLSRYALLDSMWAKLPVETHIWAFKSYVVKLGVIESRILQVPVKSGSVFFLAMLAHVVVSAAVCEGLVHIRFVKVQLQRETTLRGNGIFIGYGLFAVESVIEEEVGGECSGC